MENDESGSIDILFDRFDSVFLELEFIDSGAWFDFMRLMQVEREGIENKAGSEADSIN
jgi:hypothetical protein